VLLLLLGFWGGGCAYNYQVLQKRGEDIIPGIQYFHMAREIIKEVIAKQRSTSGGISAGATEGYQTL